MHLTKLEYSSFIKICFSCGASYTKKWVYNEGTLLVVCWLCYECVLRKDYQAIKNRKRFRYKQEIILLKEIPRIGVCNLCRAVVPFDTKKTLLHHEKYDDDDKRANTLEICLSCHNKIHFSGRII